MSLARSANAAVESPHDLSCAFYSVSDSRFFLGAVALVNSLRLVGHDEPIFIVDSGLTPAQQSRLAEHVTLIPARQAEASVLLTPLAPSIRPAQVQILIDADIIVTHALSRFIEAAMAGRIVAFGEPEPTDTRSFREWTTALDLPSFRSQPYVNAGQLFVPESLGRRLYPLWTEAQRKIDLKDTRYGRARLSDPFYFADQDVLNAVLAGHFEIEELMIAEHRLAPHYPFPGLDLVDATRLLCRYGDGAEPSLLHHILAKPWLKATRTTIYSLLLPRLLLAPDVALRLDPCELPLRLRQGRLAALDRRRAHVQTLIYAHSRRQLGRLGIRTRMAQRRRRRGGDRVMS